jgi:peptidyl-Lys metalloendopeptidase
MVFRSMLACLLAFASLSVAAGPNLSVNVSRPDGSTVGDREVLVNVAFTNTGDVPIRIVNWLLPDGELESDMFLLTRDEEAVSYLGPIVKRAPPTAQDMIALAPGESVSRTVDLAGAYDLSVSGTYSIQYAVASAHLYTAIPGSRRSDASRELMLEASVGENQLLSNEIVEWIDGRKSQPVEAVQYARTAGTPLSAIASSSIAYSGNCSAAQQSTIVDAVAAASSMTNGAVSYLNGASSATQRYTTWFGTYSNANRDVVKGHFANIKDALDNKPLTVDCKCKKSYYAYVFPSQPYKIYVCRAFWSAPLTGTDSKGGTLVHELSHFTVVAGTDDFAYGQTAAKQLAITDPAKARFNADSHEYFAENAPSLP